MNSATNQSKSTDFIVLILSFYIQIPICFIGFFLNVINVIVFYCNIRHNSPYFLFSILALANAITLILRAPQALLREECWPLCSSPQLRMYIYIFIIFLDFPITNITETISNWLTLSLAIERYLAMKHHTFSKIHCTLKNLKILTIFICNIAIVINLPFFFIYEIIFQREFNNQSGKYEQAVYTNETKFFKSELYEIHSWTRQIIVEFLPLILLCVFNFLLFHIVYNHNRKLFSTPRYLSDSIQHDSMKENQKLIVKPSFSKHPLKEKSTAVEKKLRAQKKLTILLITVILLFLIGRIPHSFAYLKIFSVLSRCDDILEECPEYQMYRAATQDLTLLCYSLNFFIYLFLNMHFRQTVCCLNNRNKQSINNGIEVKGKYHHHYHQQPHVNEIEMSPKLS